MLVEVAIVNDPKHQLTCDLSGAIKSVHRRKRTYSPMSPYEEPLFLLTYLEPPPSGCSILDFHDLRGRGWEFENLSRSPIPSG